MLRALAQAARQASVALRAFSSRQRTAALERVAQVLAHERAAILSANESDLAQGRAAGLAEAMLDRLSITGGGGRRFEGVVEAVRQIALQEDPVGQTTASWTRPSGLSVSRVRVPLGVVLMIYESRPNVTTDAAALCLRSANAVILRGGSEAKETNRALAKALATALTQEGLPESAVQLVPTQDRDAIDELLKMDDLIDLVIPRGGEGLIRRVVAESRIPVVRHYKGLCHVYVHQDADLEMATRIVLNAKTQRPGVCNAMETLLVDSQIADVFLPRCLSALRQAGVELRGCARTREMVPEVIPATESDWDEEFLRLVLAVRVVSGLPEALAHIERHGTNHTASIVTRDESIGARFLATVDASCVLVNASTRFNDGGELGLGAEMGISTSKIHAYGPMGATALTTEKFVVRGSGQVRA